MSKSKNVVKKLTTILFTLVAIFAVGLTNVNAETTTVDVEDSSALINEMNDETTDIVRLNNDIVLSSEYDTTFYIYKSKTLDLNGHTITVPNYRKIKFWYYADADIKLIDSANSNTAKIIGNHTGASEYDLLYGAIIRNAEKVNFEIDDVDFEVKNNNFITIVSMEGNKKYENLIIKNSNVNGNQFLFWSGAAKKVYLESIKLSNPTASGAKRMYLSNDSNLTINDVIDANAVVEYYSKDGVRTADRTAKLDSIDTYYGPITVKFANGFNVSNATLNGKYGETPETNITIKNIGENNLQIKNVTVSDTEKFEIIGGTQPTVNVGGTNADFKVKAKTGLGVGDYTATITVTDMGGKTYTATVTLKVEKKNLTVGISGLDSKWVYGTIKTPTATGVDGLGTGDYKITYSKENNGSVEDMGTTLPKLVGKYKATLSITNPNYTASEASVPFEITPINTAVKVKSNDATFTYDGSEHTYNAYDVLWANNASPVAGNILPNGDKVTAVITGKVRDFKDTADGNNTIESITITNADNVDVTDCYSNKVKAAGKLTVTKKDSKITVTSESANKAYDGSPLTNNNKNVTGETVAGDEVVVDFTGSQTFVGTSDNAFTVKVMRGSEDVTDNYTFGTHTFGKLTVKSAEQPLAIADQYVRVNGSILLSDLEQSVTGNVGNIDFTIKSGTALLRYDAINEEYVAGATEGDVVMTVTATAVNKGGDDTPEWKETTKDFTIHVVNKTDVNIGGLSNNETFTYDGNPKMPTGTISVNAGTVNVIDLEVLYKGTGSTSYSSTTAPTNAGTYTVTYKVPDTNANYTGTFSVAFTIKKAQLEKVTIAKDTFEYTGSDITPTLNNVNSNIEVTGDTTAKNVSNNTIVAKIKDKANYEWKDGTTTDLVLNWSITQATPNYTIPTGLTSVIGKTLNDVTLPSGFTWNDVSTVLTVGKHTYKATYTPVDTTNYKTITDIDIEVVVKNTFDVITSVDGGNGTITPSKIGAVEGTKFEITFTPNTGYMIDKVLVNTVETTVTGNKIELTVNEEKKVIVSYKKIPFTVTVKDVDGATITPNGVVAVTYGEDKEFTITANSGYKLVKVLVDETDKTADMIGDTLKLTNITSNINLEVVVEKIVYEVTEGANQKYTITKNNEAKFKINADFRLFDDGKVYVDNELVDPDNYTAESGSTIITLKKEFVDTLSVGEHTLKVLFNDGGEAITTFNVVREMVPTDNPQTGDNIGFYIISGILSIVGLAGVGIFYRRKQTN